MTDGNARLGYRLENAVGDAADGVHVVVQIEHLTAAPQLAPDRLVYHRVVMLQNIGLHRLAVHGCFFEHAHIAQAAHRHVQGARDRRCREREDVHIFDKLLEALLLLHAKALFLVDDRQAQIAEGHVLLHQTVGTDDHIDLAAFELFERFLLLLGGAEAREQLHSDRIALKALADGLIVLPRENGGRAEQGALLAVGNALERRTQRHLGFAEAHIAAEQPVHRRRALHVALDLLNAVELVGGFFIFKFCFKVALPLVIARKGVALCLHTRRIERDQLLGDVLDRGLDLCLGTLPVAGAETVETDVRALLCADVFGNHVELRDRHIEHVALGVIYFDVILGDAVGVDFADAAEHADAVDAVHHKIAGTQLGEVIDLLSLFFAPAFFVGAVGGLSVADEEEFFGRQLKAGAERALHDIDATLFRTRQALGVCRRIAVVLQALGEILCRLWGAGKHHAAAACEVETAQILGELLVGAVPLAELLGRKADDLAKRQRDAAVYKAFEHRDAVRRKPLHALAKGQRVAVKALGEHAVRNCLPELLGVLKVRRPAAFAHVAELGDKEQAVA